jgi:hypothetical protein
VSKEGEDIWQDLRENHWAGDHEVNSRVVHQDSKYECQDIVKGSAPSKTKEEATNSRVRAIDVGALTILEALAPTDWKSRMMVIYLE